jgi:hypothetical protein
MDLKRVFWNGLIQWRISYYSLMIGRPNVKIWRMVSIPNAPEDLLDRIDKTLYLLLHMNVKETIKLFDLIYFLP